jgi:hypothetical protein
MTVFAGNRCPAQCSYEFVNSARPPRSVGAGVPIATDPQFLMGQTTRQRIVAGEDMGIHFYPEGVSSFSPRLARRSARGRAYLGDGHPSSHNYPVRVVAKNETPNCLNPVGVRRIVWGPVPQVAALRLGDSAPQPGAECQNPFGVSGISHCHAAKAFRILEYDAKHVLEKEGFPCPSKKNGSLRREDREP